MSRPTVVRRLAAVTALLAVFCLALPAAAAPGAHRQPARAHAASGLVDQFFAWIGTLLPSPSQAGRTEKAGTYSAPSGANDFSSTNPKESDRGGMVDPNG
jgi:hypothetical protein